MDVTEEDQVVDPKSEARYGNKLEPGTYDFEVVKAEEGFTNGSNNSEAKPKITLALVIFAPKEKAPDGLVKVDYHCVAKSQSLRNLIETFEPAKLGKNASL